MTTETLERRMHQILQKMTSLHKDAVLLAKLMSAKKEIKKGKYITSKQMERFYPSTTLRALYSQDESMVPKESRWLATSEPQAKREANRVEARGIEPRSESVSESVSTTS